MFLKLFVVVACLHCSTVPFVLIKFILHRAIVNGWHFKGMYAIVRYIVLFCFLLAQKRSEKITLDYVTFASRKSFSTSFVQRLFKPALQ